MPTTRCRKLRRINGFSLTELSIALVIVGLSAGLYMKMNTASKAADCVIATKTQLETINQAITRYVTNTERYPLPAKRQVGVSSSEYGREITDSVTYAGIDRYNDVTGKDILIGALPFQTLGLSPSYAGDCWGNKFTYFVTTSLTVTGNYAKDTFDGQIEVANETGALATNKAAYAVISHGPNGGSSPNVVANNYTGLTTKIAGLASATSLESGNYDRGDARVISASQNATSFDDVVLFSGKKPQALNGECKDFADGGANGGSFAAEPLASAKCNPGTPEAAAPVAGQFTWSCKGLYGGTTEHGCYAINTGPTGTQCMLDGQIINDGETKTAYNTTSSADCAANSISRTCTNGTLSGDASYQYLSCNPASCTGWQVGCEPAITAPGNACEAGGGTLEMIPIVIDYTMCSGEWRMNWRCCTGGTPPATSCNLPWGGSPIADGQSVTAYSTNSSSDCAANSETRTCNNGTLSGSFTNQSCNAPACTTIGNYTYDNTNSCWKFTADATGNFCQGDKAPECGSTNGACGSDHGKTDLTASPTNKCSAGTPVGGGVGNCIEWAGPFGDCSKVQYSWTCNGTGTGTDASCSATGTVAPTSCTLPWSGTLTDGQSITAYNTSTSSDCAASAITRTCSGGVLSGDASYQYQTCSAPLACTPPWGGGTIADGQSVIAYATNVSADCAGNSQTRTCNNGVLSGSDSYQHQNCSAPLSCTLPWGGAPIADGQSVTAYSTNLSADCAGNSQIRTCNNGVLSGIAAYQYQICSAPLPCTLPWGGTIADGESRTAYSTNLSADCAGNSQTRTCNNGVLSGIAAYQYETCSAPKNCAAGSTTLSWSQGAFKCTGSTSVALADGATGTAFMRHNHISPGFSGGNDGDLPVRCVNGVLQANGSGSCFGQCYYNCGTLPANGVASCVPTDSANKTNKIRCSLVNGVARATNEGSCGVGAVKCD